MDAFIQCQYFAHLIFVIKSIYQMLYNTI